MDNYHCLSSPSVIFTGALRSFGSVLVLEQFLTQHDCIPLLQSVNSVLSLSAVSCSSKKKIQAGWPAKVTLWISVTLKISSTLTICAECPQQLQVTKGIQHVITSKLTFLFCLVPMSLSLPWLAGSHSSDDPACWWCSSLYWAHWSMGQAVGVRRSEVLPFTF